MGSNLSIREILSETIALIKFRRKYVAGMLVLIIIISAPLEWQMMGKDPIEFNAFFWSSLALSVIVCSVLEVCIFNDFITTLRGKKASLLPEALFEKIVKMTVKGIVVILATAIPTTIALAVHMFLLTLLFPTGIDSTFESEATGVILLLFFIIIGFVIPLLRLGAGVAAAAMGEQMSLKQSWKMTKGYTFKLLFFTAPYFLIQIAFLFITHNEIGFVQQDSTAAFIISISTDIISWSIFASFSVWYVRLTKRYQSMLLEEVEGMGPVSTE